MNSILNILFAWLSLVIIILLCALFPFSKLIKNEKYDHNIKIIKLRSILKQWHKPLGLSVIIVMFLHGRLAGQRPGIEAILILLLSILLACSYLLRVKFPQGWKKLHRSLSVILVLLIIIHIFSALT